MGSSQVIIREDPNTVKTNVPISQGTSPGLLELMPATLMRRHRLTGIVVTLSADGTIKFRSAGVDLTGPMDFAGKGGWSERDLGDIISSFLSGNFEIVTTGGGANGSAQFETEAP